MTFMHRNSFGVFTLSLSLLGAVAGCTASEDSVPEADAGEVDAGGSTWEASRPPTGDPGADAAGPLATFTVGGTLAGLLGAGFVLENNGTDRLSPSADGAFTFAKPVASGGAYDITVRTRPTNPGQICTVGHGKGTIGSANVADVKVTCSVGSTAIGGTVIGLVGHGLVLQNEGGDDLTVGTNGAFRFATQVASGAAYAVTIKTQPSSPAQTCSVSGGTGTTGAGDVTSVVVNCGTNTYTVGGTVTGLVGKVVLQNQGGSDLTLNANGTYAFPVPFASGKPYEITVKTQPSKPTQLCTVSNGSGTVTNANIVNANVSCQTSTFKISGRVTPGFGSTTVLQNNGGDDTGTGGSDTFTFPTGVPSGGSYHVTMKQQATSNKCYLSNESGLVTDADITSVLLTCPDHNTWTVVAPMPTPRYGAATALARDGRIYVLGGLNGGSDVTRVVEVYSPEANTWSTAAPMPTGRWFHGAVTAPDGRIFAIGGNGGTGHLSSVEAYSPTTDTWATVASLPDLLLEPGAALGADGRIYAIASNHVDAYDFATGAWTSVARMRTPREQVSAVAGTDGRIYVFGAGSADSYLPAGNTWSAATSLGSYGNGFTARAVNGSFFLVASVVGIYTPGSSTIQAGLTPQSPHVLGAGIGLPDGRIFAFGGNTTGLSAHNVTEVYTP